VSGTEFQAPKVADKAASGVQRASGGTEEATPLEAPHKDLDNQQRHGPVVHGGATALRVWCRLSRDLRRAHSEFEDRFIAIGPIDRGIVVVVYTEREEEVIRIIGARLATKREQALYRSYMEQHK
jgi:uncharacterized DUF497 family protein